MAIHQPSPYRLYLSVVLVIVGIFAVGTTFYHFSEGISWLSALYLTTATVLTIGYGDIAPHNEISRIFTIFFVIISIPTVVFLLGWIVEDFFKRKIKKIEGGISEILKEEHKILAEEELIIKAKKQEIAELHKLTR